MTRKLLENVGKILVHESFFRGSLFLGALPLLFAAFFLYLKNAEFKQIKENFAFVEEMAARTWRERLLKKEFLEKYENYDPYFLNHELEKYPFLEEESHILTDLTRHPVFEQDGTLLQRLHFLQNGANKLSFAEENIKTSKFIKETEEHQTHPVEANLSDVEKLLSLVEGVEIGRYVPPENIPQLIITNFHLEKKKSSSRPFYSLSMDLLKREFQKKAKHEAEK